MIAIQLALSLLLMTGVGVYVRKRGMVNDAFSDQLSRFLVDICLPALVFSSVRDGAPFSAEVLSGCLLALALGVLSLAISLALGQLGWLVTGRGSTGRIVRFSLAFTNFSFMGIPIVETLLGTTGRLYYVFFIVPLRLVYYGMSEPLMTPPELKTHNKPLAQRIRTVLLHPCLLGMAAGILFWVTAWPLPQVAEYVIGQLASVASPLGLILCGITLGKYQFGKLLRPRYFWLPLARCVLMPVLFYGLAHLLYPFGLDPLLGAVMVVSAALPVASLAVVFSIRYDPDENNHFEAVGAVVLSTFLCAITIPIWYLLIA